MTEGHISLVDHTDEEASPRPRTPPDSQPAQDESYIDILYENQRGWFVFGIPLFSANALWNLRVDHSPWTLSSGKPSPVNITNAQVPDPSWTWEWKSWYVDMSHDVDEEGWQYSLWFRKFAWHGNHPWFHSFVRRRRWLRKRVKVRLPPKKKDDPERLFGDRFSIGTTLARLSTAGPESVTTSPVEDELDEVIDVATLMVKLKKAAIDRERLAIFNKFIEEAGEDLYYLAEQMPVIMSMLVFQNSRRQLLANLTRTFDDEMKHLNEAKVDISREHSDDRAPENDTSDKHKAGERRIDNLKRAASAADEECKKLEYWSDIRKLTENGNAPDATNSEKGWDPKHWEGLDGSGAL